MRLSIIPSLLLCLWLAVWAPARAADIAQVFIEPQAAVKPSQMVRLGEIARIEGPQVRAQQLSAVEIARAPGPGASREVTTDWIRSRIQCAGIDRTSVRIFVGGSTVSQKPGDARNVTLIGRSQTVSGAEIAEAARQAVVDRLGTGVPCTAEVDSTPSDLSVPDGAVELVARPRAQSGPLRSGRQWVNVGIIVDGARYADVVAAVTVRVFGPVLVATQPIRSGDALTESNTCVEERELTAATQFLTERPASGAAVAGRALAAGSPIAATAVAIRPDISKGDTVLVMVKSRGVKVAVRGTAARDAATGGAVRVVLPWSKEEIQATVIEPGLAEVKLR